MERPEKSGDSEQAKADHQEAGDGAAAKRDCERFIESGARGFRRAQIGAPADLWLKITRREIDPARALMDGLYEVKGDLNLLMNMGDLFRPPAKVREEDLRQKGEKKMKILAIQGSPRPKASNTEILLQEFLKGAQSQGADTETVYLKEKEIHSCIGCYTCWAKTPRVCVFKDDMPELLNKVRNCHILVYATPLYNFNLTSLLKAFQERLLPLLDPHLIKTGEAYRHPQRYTVNRKMVLISTCGFPEVSHFDGCLVNASRSFAWSISSAGQRQPAGEYSLHWRAKTYPFGADFLAA